MKLCPRKMPNLVAKLLDAPPKKVVLSGPSGFLGSRVLDLLLQTHQLRMDNGLDPGEVIVLSSSPGRMMERLSNKFGVPTMKTLRASRVDYYSQHCKEVWRDHLLSLGLGGQTDSVFMNLAAVAGPVKGRRDALHAVNYTGAVAAAAACREVGVSHFIQSSTQATNSERAGQVPYSRAKAMADANLSTIDDMPVTIACVGVLFCKETHSVGQDFGPKKLNMIDLSILPLTPIMGSGRAPLQPQEVSDAALRLSVLALTNPELRPQQVVCSSKRLQRLQKPSPTHKNLRIYDAVGPLTISMVDMLQRFAYMQGNHKFRPVYIDYRNMEKILNVMSLGNLNRQFISLLRSEQDNLKSEPFVGDPTAWDMLTGEDEATRMVTLDSIVEKAMEVQGGKGKRFPIVNFPFLTTLKLVLRNPKVIPPAIALHFEITQKAMSQGVFRNQVPTVAEQERLFLVKFGDDADLAPMAVRALREEFEGFDLGDKGELDEHEAMLLLESKSGEWLPQSEGEGEGEMSEPFQFFEQLRSIIDGGDNNHNGRLSFLEYACMVFGKRIEAWELQASSKRQQAFLRRAATRDVLPATAAYPYDQQRQQRQPRPQSQVQPQPAVVEAVAESKATERTGSRGTSSVPVRLPRHSRVNGSEQQQQQQAQKFQRGFARQFHEDATREVRK